MGWEMKLERFAGPGWSRRASCDWLALCLVQSLAAALWKFVVIFKTRGPHFHLAPGPPNDGKNPGKVRGWLLTARDQERGQLSSSPSDGLCVSASSQHVVLGRSNK